MGSIVLGCLFEPRVDALLDCMAVVKQRGIIEEVVELDDSHNADVDALLRCVRHSPP